MYKIIIYNKNNYLYGNSGGAEARVIRRFSSYNCRLTCMCLNKLQLLYFLSLCGNLCGNKYYLLFVGQITNSVGRIFCWAKH